VDDVLAKRDEINTEIQAALDVRTEQWGVQITAVEIKDIALPQEMKRAIARQAEAERERRAKGIMSEGELQAAEKLTQAARLIGAEPAALQLRLYQTLVEVSSERNNTIVLPVPIEILTAPNPSAAAHLASSAATALAVSKQRELALEERAKQDSGGQKSLPSSSEVNDRARLLKAELDALLSPSGKK